jgi:subtilisin family serine protease
VVVAVLDTGITMTHPDLDGSLWSDGQGAHGATISMDLDGDGSCSGTCEMCPNNTPTDNDNHYHGTHVAGLIGAEVNNTDIVGIAHGAKIMGVKVLGACGTTSIGTSLAIAQGIIFAADSVSASERLVINMSLGGGPAEQVMKDAIDYAINKKNAVIVAATGNDGAPCKINYPAAYDNVISVGATKENDSLAFFSCSGGAIDLVAPGDGVNNGDGVISLNAPAGTSYLAGTSFASPIVAGVAALVRSVNPNLSPIEVNRILDFTADDLGTQGWDGAFGYGRVNALKAVQAARANTTFTSNPGFPGETFPAPNPYRPMDGRTVKFFLPANMGSTDIRIKIMDLLGQEVKTLSGTTEWDGKNADGNYVASGLYIYEVKTSQGDKRGKITVLK